MEIERAFVLNSMDYKESSKILYLYTEKGHFSVIAHGVKKMNSLNRFLSQNGTQIKLTTTQAKFPSLKEGEIINDYEYIKKDLESYTFQNHIMECVKHNVSNDSNHQKMYHFLDKIFHLMNQGRDAEILSFVFELKLLYFIGYGLNFKTCLVCDENKDLVFHPSHGGVVCKHHLKFNDKMYDYPIYKLVNDLYRIDLDKTDLPDVNQSERYLIREILDLLYDEFMSFKSKSREIIKQIKKY